MLGLFAKRKERYGAARNLYMTAARQMRMPVFYQSYAVPDTLEGRFDLLAMHGFLIVERLRNEGRAGRRLSQAFFDVMFRNLEYSIREAGVGDLSVPKHMKKMMRAFKGRSLNYHHALEHLLQNHDDTQLKQAVSRNIYGGNADIESGHIEAMVSYMLNNYHDLQKISFADIEQGHICFTATGNDNKEVDYGDAGMVA